jgi:anti-sigma regulatory factor (Ser/Thr protein kinase)
MDYAAPAGREGRIELSCSIADGRIELELRDDGPAFDPTGRPPPPRPASLAEARPGGLGIHLIRSYTSRMEYRREGTHNVLRLTLPLDAAADSRG